MSLIKISKEKIAIFFTYILLFFAVIRYFVDQSTLYPQTLLILLFLALVFARHGLKLPLHEYLLAILMVYVALGGEYFAGNAYQIIPYYDKLGHLFVSFGLTLITYKIIQRNGMKYNRYIISLLTVMGMGALVEIQEYLFDTYLHPAYPAQGVFNSHTLTMIMPPLQDTMIDLMCGFSGSVIAILFIFILKRIEMKYEGLKLRY